MIDKLMNDCKLNWAEKGIYIIMYESNSPMTVEEIMSFSIKDNRNFVQVSLDNLIKNGYIAKENKKYKIIKED